MINPHMDFRNIPKWDGSRINNFMVSRETFIKNYDEHITIADSVWGKSMSVKEYPEHWGISDVARYLGDIIENTNIGVPCIVALNVIKYPESEKGVIKRNASLVLGQQMPYALFPRLRLKHEDLQYGMERLEKNESLYHATFGLYVFAESEEELKEACGEIKAYYRRLRCSPWGMTARWSDSSTRTVAERCSGRMWRTSPPYRRTGAGTAIPYR